MPNYKPYFDLHLHPSSKIFMANLKEWFDNKKLKKLNFNQLRPANPGGITDEIISRAHFERLAGVYKNEKGDEEDTVVNILVAPIIPGERAFLKWGKGSVTGTLGQWISKINRNDFNVVLAKDGKPYGTLFEEELKFLEKFANHFNKASKDIKVLFAGEVQKPLEDNINLIMAIEGGHMLEREQNVPITDSEIEQIIQLREDRKRRFLYLTLCHTTRWELCTHAYAGKVYQKNPYFLPRVFNDDQKGTRYISEKGYKVLEACFTLDENKKAPLLIDIKHMSVGARHEFYAFREKWLANAAEGTKLPILATHIGVTGFRKEALIKTYFGSGDYKACTFQVPKGGDIITDNENFVMVEYAKEAAQGIKVSYEKDDFIQTYFSPNTINIYDEDIEEVFRSEGYIGLMLAKGRLGLKAHKEKKMRDVFPFKEFELFEGYGEVKLTKAYIANPKPGKAPNIKHFDASIFEPDDAYAIEDMLEEGEGAFEFEDTEQEELAAEYVSLAFLDKLSEHYGKDLIADVFEVFFSEIGSGEGFIKNEEIASVTKLSQYNSFQVKAAKDAIDSYRKEKRLWRHMAHFANNLLHIIRVGTAMGDKPSDFNPWKHVCLGSDYGGFIIPIAGCRTPQDYGRFEETLINVLVGQEGKQGMIEAALTDPKFRSTFSLKNVNTNFEIVDQKNLEEKDNLEGEVRSKIRDMMFNNGQRFIMNHFWPKDQTPNVQ